ncbi:hypothetical protein CI109_100800 [Kwoniella shandongensis]|uniref:Uncharacterized protein n=1 Tax=Kwoniella shandongensis TaxID=1734106 RepID=A0A5M6BWG7_9TREE|nr:uncharacterized protein CI109_005021 [Kwoniella shandongensis]KAA5526631.1 hypothetical protein CI109_005021 [Kwoniella shandongensis]
MSDPTTSSSSRPVFEPTDIFDFDFPPPPQPVSTDISLDVDPITNEVVGNASGNSWGKIDTSPREFREAPSLGGSDFDEDEMAMMEMERESEKLRSTSNTARNTAASSRDIGQSAPNGASQDDWMNGPSQPQPVASSSRNRPALTPPPEREASPIDLAPLPMFESYLDICTLPTLRAETAEGKMVSFKRRNRPKPPVIQTTRTHKGVTTKTDAGDLLSVPLHRLLAEVDELKSQQKAIKLQQRYDEEQRRAERGVLTATSINSTMWVDKYRPKKFSDLLGEDRVHREVMGWLKEWDKCVFKRTLPGKKRKVEESENFVYDPLGRPRERILLLSGPPGYGKTTLAHIVARHAGYRTLEINASDDRSAATVSTRIKNAIESGTGLASEGKPTCVVIDEIDGASGGGDASFVRSLIKLIQDVPAKKKSNTPAKPLRRPIICICNDLYATTLRPLRPFARIIRFRKPQAQFLVKRLREICDRETLSADLRVLTTLVDVTSGDVRSCLNTLQFIKSKTSAVTDEAIKSSSVGLKDSGTTLQSVWNSLFIPIAAKQRRRAIGIDDGRYVDRISFQVQACGDYDKVVQGCFEHYPNLKPMDASLGNLCKVHDWLGYYDRLATKVGDSQEWELMGYMPYAITAWYSHLASPANNTKPTEWPKADYESYQARIANEEIATNMKALIPPIMRSLFLTTTTYTELIPLLMRIISPPLKPVNANIVKPAERAVLSRLVELMIPLGLQFWQEKGENGQPMMRLEPPIDVFVHYDGKRADDIIASRFAVRQLVAQAMDAEIARRSGAAGAEGTGTGADSFSRAYGLKSSSSMPGTGGVPTGQKIDKADLPATDFFGRQVSLQTTPSILLSVQEPTDEISPLRTGAVAPPVHLEKPSHAKSIFGFSASTSPLPVEQPPMKKRFVAKYKFHEGSLSAVRRNIKMSALM